MNLILDKTPYTFKICRECQELKNEIGDWNWREMCEECMAKAIKKFKKVFTKENILFTMKQTNYDPQPKKLYCLEWSGTGSSDLPTFYYGHKDQVLQKMLEDDLIGDWINNIEFAEMENVTNQKEMYLAIVSDWKECIEEVDCIVVK